MIEKVEVPDFATEAEEAQWWFDHRDTHDDRLLAAIKDGSARRVADVLFDYGLTLEGLKEVAVPVRPEDVELARSQAEGAGMDYREYMGKLLHESLIKSDAA